VHAGPPCKQRTWTGLLVDAGHPARVKCNLSVRWAGLIVVSGIRIALPDDPGNCS
jgi:hypothetical protein